MIDGFGGEIFSGSCSSMIREFFSGQKLIFASVVRVVALVLSSSIFSGRGHSVVLRPRRDRKIVHVEVERVEDNHKRCPHKRNRSQESSLRRRNPPNENRQARPSNEK